MVVKDWGYFVYFENKLGARLASRAIYHPVERPQGKIFQVGVLNNSQLPSAIFGQPLLADGSIHLVTHQLQSPFAVDLQLSCDHICLAGGPLHGGGFK